MPRLYDYLNQDVTNLLGVSDVLRQRQLEAEQLGQTMMRVGELEAKTIAAKREKQAGLMSGIGSALGAAAGFVLSGGNPMAATAGAQLGGAIGRKGISGAGEVLPGMVANYAVGELAKQAKIDDLKTEMALKGYTQEQPTTIPGYTETIPTQGPLQPMQTYERQAGPFISSQSSPTIEQSGPFVGNRPYKPENGQLLGQAPLQPSQSSPIGMGEQVGPFVTQRQVPQKIQAPQGAINVPISGQSLYFSKPEDKLEQANILTAYSNSLKDLQASGWVPTANPGPNSFKTAAFGKEMYFDYNPELKPEKVATPTNEKYFAGEQNGNRIYKWGIVDQKTGQIIPSAQDQIAEVQPIRPPRQYETPEEKAAGKLIDPTYKLQVAEKANNFVKDFSRSKQYLDAYQQFDAAKTLYSVVNSDNPLANKAFPTLIRKLFKDTGNVAVAEQVSTQYFGGAIDNLLQWIENNKTGKISENMKENLNNAMKIFMKDSEQTINNQIQSKKVEAYSNYSDIPGLVDKINGSLSQKSVNIDAAIKQAQDNINRTLIRKKKPTTKNKPTTKKEPTFSFEELQ